MGDPDFTRQSGIGATTALYSAFLLSLSRYPVNYLPEVVGIHYAYHAMGIDDLLLGTAPVITGPEVKVVLSHYLDLLDAKASEKLIWRLARSIALAVELEVQHVCMLVEIAERSASQTLDGKVADIIKRHAQFAGKQHRRVRIGDLPLAERFADPDLDIPAFLKDFKRSRYVRPNRSGGYRFTDALKIGGPMFGIFTEQEACTLKDWIEHIPDTVDQPIVITSARPTEQASIKWLENIRRCKPAGVVFEVAADVDDRTLLHRLVNIENFPHVLAIAGARAEAGLAAARTLFDTGAGGKYTDASFFPYTPDALMERVTSVYWTKLVDPYAPLEQIPPRDDVIFGQKTFALGSLIDGSWVFRIGNAGRYNHTSDGMLFAIYADEMGMGDIRKNHITLIHRVLGSMDINLPHIRDEAFVDQDEIPDAFYAFPINQLCLGLFADRFYPEIVGYNLGIEMFGLGELRLHEMQKLRHWGFDPIYEEAHLSIDNVSAGHARQAATIIQSYLGRVDRQFGPAGVDAQWRRIWNGYALFAYFAEGCQAGEVCTTVPADAPDHHAGLLI
ncbi:iron-containing redox enzyme family protein [uncultured Bradyrhizobium sp.]|uniref:iron-containing redox enzyme family protein n=1 Tax=uncultured Bradyrhizobium sp. TaxID=199684 RepID=UPI0035CAD6E1